MTPLGDQMTTYIGRRELIAVLGAIIALMALAGSAPGQTYPNRPITLMVSTTAGASPDLIARLFAQQLSDTLRATVVVENKGGANGQIAVQAIANAPPDGYTFLVTPGQLYRSIQPYIRKPHNSS
jgi:tripartite-type tricarboxylate transporter receptor subunit TctC